jgi:hypothetical protein
MFLIAELQAPAGLAYVLQVACVAFEGVDTTSVVGYRLWFGGGFRRYWRVLQDL